MTGFESRVAVLRSAGVAYRSLASLDFQVEKEARSAEFAVVVVTISQAQSSWL